MYFMIPTLKSQKRAQSDPEEAIGQATQEHLLTDHSTFHQIHNHNLKWIFNYFKSDLYKALRETI